MSDIMQNFDVMQAPDGHPFGQIADDEVLVVLGKPQMTRAPWVEACKAKAFSSLKQDHHYSSWYIGFDGASGQKPYVIVDWHRAGNNSLERRWVLHSLDKVLSKQLGAKRLVIYLEHGSGSEELAIAEDVFTRFMTPLYEGSRLDSFRVLSPEAKDLMSADLYRNVRLKHQLGFRAAVNENPDSFTSLALGERLAAFCEQHGATFEAFDERQLSELGMNLLLAVGQASRRSPSRLFLAGYNLTPGVRPLLLVGKGVTFDTGGINLKPHEGFVNCIKNDMGGAGLMMSLFMALVESGYDKPLVLAIPACENLIDARSMKPGAIVRSYAGKDVIIEHTDAEGRLILADALHYAQKHFNPEATILAATLTTAALRQFTNFFTAVHFAPEPFKQALSQAAEAWGEKFTFWDEFLPFLEGNKTIAADLTNLGRMPSHASMGGGSNVAAHFMKEFATTPLIHCDIFASTWNWSSDYPGAHYGATGAAFNSLFSVLRQQAPSWF